MSRISQWEERSRILKLNSKPFRSYSPFPSVSSFAFCGLVFLWLIILMFIDSYGATYLWKAHTLFIPEVEILQWIFSLSYRLAAMALRRSWSWSSRSEASTARLLRVGRKVTVGCCLSAVDAHSYEFSWSCFNWLRCSGSSKGVDATIAIGRLLFASTRHLATEIRCAGRDTRGADPDECCPRVWRRLDENWLVRSRLKL